MRHMPESLDNKFVGAFAEIDVKLDNIDKKESFQGDVLPNILAKLIQVEHLLKMIEKPPKT